MESWSEMITSNENGSWELNSKENS
jgi:hypothetical protein